MSLASFRIPAGITSRKESKFRSESKARLILNTSLWLAKKPATIMPKRPPRPNMSPKRRFRPFLVSRAILETGASRTGSVFAGDPSLEEESPPTGRLLSENIGFVGLVKLSEMSCSSCLRHYSVGMYEYCMNICPTLVASFKWVSWMSQVMLARAYPHYMYQIHVPYLQCYSDRGPCYYDTQ